MNRLDGKVAIVFGAGPNLGGTIAHFFAKEGARVAVSDLSQEVAEETAHFLTGRGYDVIALSGDATDETDVERVVRAAVGHFGYVDTAVNMAGKILWGSIVDLDVQEWSEAVLSFPKAGLLTTKHTARAIIAAGRRGSIVHILSTAAHYGEASGAAYTASKAALMNLARSAAMDLAHDGIRVNTVTPCAMEHQVWARMADELKEDFQRPDRRSFYSRDDYLKMIPLERFPRASDIALAAVYLASDDASVVTGIDIPVDGGLRVKYPVWRPGDYTGVNIRNYVDGLKVTRYGEPVADLSETVRGRDEG